MTHVMLFPMINILHFISVLSEVCAQCHEIHVF